MSSSYIGLSLEDGDTLFRFLRGTNLPSMIRIKEIMSDPLKPILLVDDEPEIVTMFREVLKRDYTVYTATNGEEALDLLREKDIDVVVADHMMPKMTGVELLKAAHDIKPKTARVLVTASQEVEHLRDAINLARVHRFVSKPVRLVELRAVVSGALRESSLETENTSLVDELQEKNRLLNRALSRVQNHERELEREVASRTSELQDANEKLKELALKDGLTGVYNHRFFQESLSAELARAARHQHSVGLVFIDVDYFKNFNDKAGHQAGDIQKTMPDIDRLASAGRRTARLGDRPRERARISKDRVDRAL